MIKLSPLPALLVSALISSGFAATPALAAPDFVPAIRNGAPVLLRAEYVPASQFAAATQAQIPPAVPPAPGYAQNYALPAYLPVETYRANQQRANPDEAHSLAGFSDAGANRAAYQPRQAAGWQAAYQVENGRLPYEQASYEQAPYEQAAYDQGQYDRGQYDQAGDQRAAYEQAAYEQADYGQYAPPPATIIHSRSVVPAYYPVPVGYAVRGGWGGSRGGWNRGWNSGFNRGFNGGWGWNRSANVVPGNNRGRGGYGGYGAWNNPRNFGGVSVGIGSGYGGYGYRQGGYYGGGYYGGRGGGCRSSGGGALVGSVAGATLGYGLANRWNRGTGVVIGGIVGALAGSAIERSGRC